MTGLYDWPSAGPNHDAVKIQLNGAPFDSDLIVAALAAEQPNDAQARYVHTTQTTKVRERCHGSFLRVQRAVLHASWLCKQWPIPHRLAAMSGRPSATNIAWAIHSFASRRVGPLTPADGPPTGRAGPMSGPAGRPSGSPVLSGRKAIGSLVDRLRREASAAARAPNNHL